MNVNKKKGMPRFAIIGMLVGIILILLFVLNVTNEDADYDSLLILLYIGFVSLFLSAIIGFMLSRASVVTIIGAIVGVSMDAWVILSGFPEGTMAILAVGLIIFFIAFVYQLIASGSVIERPDIINTDPINIITSETRETPDTIS